MRRAGATELDSSQGKYLLITPDMSEDLLDHSTCRYPEESRRNGGREGRREEIVKFHARRLAKLTPRIFVSREPW